MGGDTSLEDLFEQVDRVEQGRPPGVACRFRRALRKEPGREFVDLAGGFRRLAGLDPYQGMARVLADRVVHAEVPERRRVVLPGGRDRIDINVVSRAAAS